MCQEAKATPSNASSLSTKEENWKLYFFHHVHNQVQVWGQRCCICEYLTECKNNRPKRKRQIEQETSLVLYVPWPGDVQFIQLDSLTDAYFDIKIIEEEIEMMKDQNCDMRLIWLLWISPQNLTTKITGSFTPPGRGISCRSVLGGLTCQIIFLNYHSKDLS